MRAVQRRNGMQAKDPTIAYNRIPRGRYAYVAQANITVVAQGE